MNDYDFEIDQGYHGVWRIKVLPNDTFLVYVKYPKSDIWNAPLQPSSLKNIQNAEPGEWRDKLIKMYNDHVAENILLK